MRRVVLRGLGAAVAVSLSFAVACDDGGVGPRADEPKSWWCPYMPLTVGNTWVFEFYSIDWREVEKHGELKLTITPKMRRVDELVAFECEFDWNNGNHLSYRTLAYCRDTCFFLNHAGDEWFTLVSPEIGDGHVVDFFSGFVLGSDPRGGRVEVPAGTFEDCVHLLSSYGSEVIHVYYARGVGPVYWDCQYKDPWDPEYQQLRLTSYKLHKP